MEREPLMMWLVFDHGLAIVLSTDFSTEATVKADDNLIQRLAETLDNSILHGSKLILHVPKKANYHDEIFSMTQPIIFHCHTIQYLQRSIIKKFNTISHANFSSTTPTCLILHSIQPAAYMHPLGH